jgi:hypothetical protein
LRQHLSAAANLAKSMKAHIATISLLSRRRRETVKRENNQMVMGLRDRMQDGRHRIVACTAFDLRFPQWQLQLFNKT